MTRKGLRKEKVVHGGNVMKGPGMRGMREGERGRDNEGLIEIQREGRGQEKDSGELDGLKPENVRWTIASVKAERQGGEGEQKE